MDSDLKDTIKEPGMPVWIIVTVIILCVILTYYAVMVSLGPSRKMDELSGAFKPAASADQKINPKIFSDSAYLSLIRKKAFLQTRTLMAQTDSIYLTINLPDSTADVEISGVTVYSAKIASYRMSSILSKGDRNVIYSMFSQPLTIQNSISSIRKEPLMIKIAPKDTSEYQPDVVPDTSLVEPVNYIFETENGLRIYIYQQEENDEAGRSHTFRFDMKERLKDTWISIKNIAVFKVPEYHPYIKIRIPRQDAKIIYRALPRNGQIGIYT
jgi:hypothetical protein